MKLFDYFRFRKKKKAETEAMQDVAVTPIDFDPSEIQPPDSRFTEDYQAFLEAQETELPPESDAACSQSGTESD